MDISDRAGIAGGVACPAVLLLSVAVGAVSSPVWDWPVDPFSLVGTTGGAEATFFNAGLAVAGLAALPFGVHLWRTWSRAVGGVYGVIGVSLVGAGSFPAGTGATLHEVFGAGVLFGIWVLLWTAAIVDWRAGNPRAGAAVFLLGSVTLGAWLPYDLGARWAQLGYGAAELVSFVAFAVWSAWAAARRWRQTATVPASRREAETAGGREEEAS